MKQGQVILVALVLGSLVLIGWIVRPFASGLFMAAVFAGALHPAFERLAVRLRGRRKLAAAIVTLTVFVAIILPLSGIAAFAVKEAADTVSVARKALEEDGIRGLIDELPRPLRRPAERVADFISSDDVELGRIGGATVGKAAPAVGRGVVATGRAAVQGVLMLVALFFLLLDGEALVRYLGAIVPLPEGDFEEVLSDFRRTSVAVLRSSVVTAAVQATVALPGYLIAGIPNAFFYGLVTFFLALIPVIGGAGVGVVLGAYLLLTGHTLAGILLAAYAVAVVGLVDNVVKPWLMKGGIELHGAVVFFALLGGLAVFGPIGLIAGPAIVVFFVSLVKIYDRRFGKEARRIELAGAAPGLAPAPVLIRRPDRRSGAPPRVV